MPIFKVPIEATEPLLARGLWRDSGIVHERMQRAFERILGLVDKMVEVGGVAEIGGDVVGPVWVALAFGRHGVTRAGDDPPSGVAEAFDRGVPDPAARAGQQQDLARAAHRAATRRGKLARGSSIPSGS